MAVNLSEAPLTGRSALFFPAFSGAAVEQAKPPALTVNQSERNPSPEQVTVDTILLWWHNKGVLLWMYGDTLG